MTSVSTQSWATRLDGQGAKDLSTIIKLVPPKAAPPPPGVPASVEGEDEKKGTPQELKTATNVSGYVELCNEHGELLLPVMLPSQKKQETLFPLEASKHHGVSVEELLQEMHVALHTEAKVIKEKKESSTDEEEEFKKRQEKADTAINAIFTKNATFSLNIRTLESRAPEHEDLSSDAIPFHRWRFVADAKATVALDNENITSVSRPLFPSTYDLDGLCEFLADKFDVQGASSSSSGSEKKKPKILVMCGAGISVAAGIPDFRTPGIGLYSQLEKYNLPYPEAVFTLDYLHKNPEIFYTVANDMQLWPGLFPPTHVHHFVRLLEEKGMLLRCYTQNIDTLERSAGVTDEKIVEAHGSFASASCASQSCKALFDIDKLRALAEKKEVPRCEKCGSVAKPDVVFFGEGLPKKFFANLEKDCEECDLLFIFGTSLQVAPFNAIPDFVGSTSRGSRFNCRCPRVLFNMQRAGDGLRFQNETFDSALKGKRLMRDANDSGTSSDDDEEEEVKRERRAKHKVIQDAHWKNWDEFQSKLFGATTDKMNSNLCGKLFGSSDLFLRGDCQKIVKDLAAAMGFGDELAARFRAQYVEIKGEEPPSSRL